MSGDKTIYIGIVGSTLRSEKEKIKEIIIKERLKHDEITIVSGGAIGIDDDAQDACKQLGIPILIIYPKLEEYIFKGDNIYFERNKCIAIKSTYLYAFPHGERCGTMNTVNHFIRLGKKERLTIID